MLQNGVNVVKIFAYNRNFSDYCIKYLQMLALSNLIKNFSEEPLTRQIMLSLLSDYKRPNDKISEMVKDGYLRTVKKGLYLPGSKLDIISPELFLVANHLRGPSYISLEASLSHWGFIPERVYEITSVTTKTTKSYITEIGRFSYQHLPVPYYSMGINRIELTKKQAVLMASPEKAICDKIVTTSGILLRSVSQVMTFLTEDMRIDENMLTKLNPKTISSWIQDAPKKSSLEMLTKTLKTL